MPQELTIVFKSFLKRSDRVRNDNFLLSKVCDHYIVILFSTKLQKKNKIKG